DPVISPFTYRPFPMVACSAEDATGARLEVSATGLLTCAGRAGGSGGGGGVGGVGRGGGVGRHASLAGLPHCAQELFLFCPCKDGGFQGEGIAWTRTVLWSAGQLRLPAAGWPSIRLVVLRCRLKCSV